jgi:poly(A) polymerase
MLGLSDACADAKDYNKLYPVSGIFENQNLKKFVPNFRDFQILVSFVKHWASARQVYGKAFGFLGGVSWSIMVAYFLNVTRCRSGLIAAFFEFYSTTRFSWLEPVSLINVERFVVEFAKKYQQSRAPVMILQSVLPYHNTARNVSEQGKWVLRAEIDRACKLLNEARESEKNYEVVCTPVQLNDFNGERRMVFRLVLRDSSDLVHIFTLMKAKVQGLVTALERNLVGLRVRPLTGLLTGDDGSLRYLIGLGPAPRLGQFQTDLIAELAANFVKSVKSMSHTPFFSIDFRLE